MAYGLNRGQRAEGRGRNFCRGCAAHYSESCRTAAHNLPSSVVRLLSSVLCLLFSVLCCAEELTDPTRPPVSIAEPVAGAVGTPSASLQSIIIGKHRRAAIIDGQTIELGTKYNDAKLVEVREGSVVLRTAQGRQILTLFPDVKIILKNVASDLPPTTVRTGMKKNKPGTPGSKHGTRMETK